MFPTDESIRKGTLPGSGAVAVDTPAGRLGGILCFDLNFDELRDEYTRLRPDILCFSSYFHGAHVQANWALRTHAFFAGAVKDGTSDILDPLGRVLNSTTYYNRIAWARINLDRFVMHGACNSEKWPDIRRKYSCSRTPACQRGGLSERLSQTAGERAEKTPPAMSERYFSEREISSSLNCRNKTPWKSSFSTLYF